MKRPWFSNTNATSLEIQKFKSISDHEIVASVIINDLKVIQSFISRIEQIPPEGDMMKSFGPEAEHIDLCFFNEDALDIQHIYQKRFKTPSTGFNSSKSELEEKLYQDVDALLFPALDKQILQIENLELVFKNFSITYLGSEFHQVELVSVSFTKNKFLIKEKNKKEQLIEITSGQLPPKPFAFEIGHSKFEILTYKTKDDQRLYADHFQIVAIK